MSSPSLGVVGATNAQLNAMGSSAQAATQPASTMPVQPPAAAEAPMQAAPPSDCSALGGQVVAQRSAAAGNSAPATGGSLAINGKTIKKDSEEYKRLSKVGPAVDGVSAATILDSMIKEGKWKYKNEKRLEVEIIVRLYTAKAARDFAKAKVGFNSTNLAEFGDGKGGTNWDYLPKAFVNGDEQTKDKRPKLGALKLKKDSVLSEGIKELFNPDRKEKLSVDCGTACMIILTKGRVDWAAGEGQLANLDRATKGNVVFGSFKGTRILTVSDNPNINRPMLPGDVVLFSNPDGDKTGWQSENAIYVGNNLFYAHGIMSKREDGG